MRTEKAHLKNNIAVTTGDPASIGPEVVFRALIEYGGEYAFMPVVIGDYAFLSAKYPELIKKISFKITTMPSPDISGDRPCFIDIANTGNSIRLGNGSALSGKASLDYIDCSIELWKRGLISAVATAPVNKGFICETGCSFSGHTEYYAQHTGGRDPYMLMYSEKYRVILVSTHYPVFSLQKHVSFRNILETIRMANTSFGRMEGTPPKIAVCGLDPHCGDNGAVGNFDMNVTLPAISAAREEGIDAWGPFAADTVFLPEKWSGYSCVVAHYHDQGLIPFKILAFENGVNITLGLPIVRTSADHGTAYDIAGKGIADYRSMKSAMDTACLLSAGRQL